MASVEIKPSKKKISCRWWWLNCCKAFNKTSNSSQCMHNTGLTITPETHKVLLLFSQAWNRSNKSANWTALTYTHNCIITTNKVKTHTHTYFHILNSGRNICYNTLQQVWFCISRAHSPVQCVSLHPESPSCLTSLTDSKVATVGLTGFLYQTSWCSQEH